MSPIGDMSKYFYLAHMVRKGNLSLQPTCYQIFAYENAAGKEENQCTLDFVDNFCQRQKPSPQLLIYC